MRSYVVTTGSQAVHCWPSFCGGNGLKSNLEYLRETEIIFPTNVSSAIRDGVESEPRRGRVPASVHYYSPRPRMMSGLSARLRTSTNELHLPRGVVVRRRKLYNFQ